MCAERLRCSKGASGRFSASSPIASLHPLEVSGGSVPSVRGTDGQSGDVPGRAMHMEEEGRELGPGRHVGHTRP